MKMQHHSNNKLFHTNHIILKSYISRNSVYKWYEPISGQCAYFITPENTRKPVLEPLFKKVLGLQACNFITKRLQHRFLVFRVYKMGTLTRNGLRVLWNNLWISMMSNVEKWSNIL